MRRPGGWPMSMFLTADGKPIFGGTYWPPEDKDGRRRQDPRLQDASSKRCKKFRDEQAQGVAASRPTRWPRRRPTLLAGQSRGVALVDLDRDLVAGAVDALKDEFDPIYGGFGIAGRKFRGPKFPDAAVAATCCQHEAGRTKVEGTRRHGARSRSTTWPAAASTTSSAAASIATAPNAPGPCRTSRRCSTTTPSCCEVYAAAYPSHEEAALSSACCGRRSASSSAR